MKPQQIKEMLYRSDHAPLNVFIETTEYHHDTALHLLEVYREETLLSVFNEMNRFQRLQINVSMLIHRSFKALAYEVLWLLDQPAPMLQEFYLNAELHHLAELYEGRNFIQTLFSGIAPNLKHILRQVSDDLQSLSCSPCFRNLYSLQLRLRKRAVIHSDIFLDILESSPFLHTLEIRLARENTTIIPPESAARRVALPHLQSLSLKDFSDVGLANLVLGHLIFPQNVNYHIRCVNFQRKISQTALLMQFIAQQRLAHLQMSFFRCGIVYLTFHEQHLAPHADTFSIKDEVSPEIEESLHNLLWIFKLSDITSLTLHFVVESTNTPTRLIDTFPLLINLKFLQIRYDFWDALRDTVIPASILMLILPPPFASWCRDGGPNDRDRDAPPACPCPSLRTLDISIKRDCMKLNEAYATVLQACSNFRLKIGYPLEAITIHCPELSLTEEAAALLQPSQDLPITVLKENFGKISLC